MARIQNNIMAMNTHRMYTINNKNVSKSAEKLSSGYRVNRAGDDAAGLAISEKMRAQIRGLNMATKNSNDAISLVQTAEGALQEVQNMLQRMNELAVQAASDTNVTLDRDALQLEFQNLQDEIDQIAQTTKFNDTLLLNGDYAKTKKYAADTTGLDAAATVAAGANVGAITHTLDADAVGKALAEATGVAEGDYTLSVAGDGAGTYTLNATDADGNVIALATSAATPTADTANATTIDFGDLGTVEIAAGTTGGDQAAVEAAVANLDLGTVALAEDTTPPSNLAATGTLTAPADVVATATTAAPAHGGIAFTLDQDALSAALIDGGATAQDYTIALTSDAAGNFTLNATGADGSVIELGTATATAVGATGTSQTLNFDGLSIEVTGLTATGAGAAANVGQLDALIVAAAGTDLGTLTVAEDPNAAAAAEEGLIVQVGAEEGHTLAITIDAMNTTGLKVTKDQANIATRQDASKAITTVRAAINAVSMQRATLGAMQNRLEYKVNNLSTTVENLQAAESQIRDVDMAKEMSNFTKNNILVQASTAMLAQANSLPQNVLQLLG